MIRLKEKRLSSAGFACLYEDTQDPGFAVAMLLPCCCHAVAVLSQGSPSRCAGPCHCHAVAMLLPCCCHAVSADSHHFPHQCQITHQKPSRCHPYVCSKLAPPPGGRSVECRVLQNVAPSPTALRNERGSAHSAFDGDWHCARSGQHMSNRARGVAGHVVAALRNSVPATPRGAVST